VSRTLPATAGLVAATAIWGSTFVVTKGSLDQLSPPSLLAWRFGIAAAVLLLVRRRTVRTLPLAEWRHALVLGGALSAGFLLQTTGLLHIPAGASGFLTGAAVVLTPVVSAALFKDVVGPAGWIAVALSAGGIAGLTGSGTAASPAGAALTLGGAACFAVHISGLSQWSTRQNAYALTACSVGVAAVVCLAVALVAGGLSVPTTPHAWTAVLYLSLLATCLGFAVQAWAQSTLTATAAAVTMTMEPVFAAAIAITLGEQAPSPAGWLGGALIVAGMTVAELGPRECCDALSPRIECC
jgi:drug/metabolite transporter (DMT)-like permease